MSIDCYNHVVFHHTDTEQCERLVKASMYGNLFREFVPMHPDNSWESCRHLWGVKWDARVGKVIIDKSLGNITVQFTTANGPPIQFMEHMMQESWKIGGYWWVTSESCGRYWSDDSLELHEDVCKEPLIDIHSPADVDHAIRLEQDLAHALYEDADHY